MIAILISTMTLFSCSLGSSTTNQESPVEPPADDKYSKGLEYRLNYDSKSYSVSGIGTCTDTDIVIPSIYNGFPVISISSSAFRGCTSLTSVEIPDSVRSIGMHAFAECTSLTSIVIPDSVTSIAFNAFFDCTSLTIYCEATSKPSGWDAHWNYYGGIVIWGYKGN